MRNIVTLFTALVLAFAGTAALAAETPAGSEAGQSFAAVERVNINSADAQTLADRLHRVGAKKAESIVAWREANGNFTSVEQLMEVKGIGEATLAANRDRVEL